jgi:multicomponent Na+:H+ antiporter subunit D
MLEFSLNPGFVCILAALIVLGSPRVARPPIMAGAALVALWLMLDRDFGAAASQNQMGLPIVPLSLDALNRIFGIAMLIALIAIAICTGSRRHRSEDAAILLLAGGSVSALFVGDLVSFVAASALAGLASAWLVFASPVSGSARSGVRLLVWQGIEGLLLLIGVAFLLAAGATSSKFERLDLDIASIGGAALFAALMIRVGAPLAHVWLKDAIAHASPVGAGALSAFSSMLGVYALARLYPGEPVLAPIGMAMLVIGVAYAMAEDDMRRAAASGLTAHVGLCVMLIGIGSPLALAAAEGHAFTTIFAFLALQLVLGAVLGRIGHVRVSEFEGLSRLMPISALLLAAAGLAVAAVPGFALYATTAIALESTAQWQLEWAWALTGAASSALFAALMLRPTLAAFRGMGRGPGLNEAPFPMLLGAGLATFFCLSVGLAPSWLYGLLPTALAFDPYALDRVAPHLELLGAVGIAYVLLRASRLTAAERPLRLLDVDSFYRGPASGAARWSGVVMLRLYGAWQALLAQLAMRSARRVSRWTRDWDRPYRPRLAGLVQVLVLVIGVVLAIFWRQISA